MYVPTGTRVRSGVAANIKGKLTFSVRQITRMRISGQTKPAHALYERKLIQPPRPEPAGIVPPPVAANGLARKKNDNNAQGQHH